MPQDDDMARSAKFYVWLVFTAGIQLDAVAAFTPLRETLERRTV